MQGQASLCASGPPCLHTEMLPQRINYRVGVVKSNAQCQPLACMCMSIHVEVHAHTHTHTLQIHRNYIYNRIAKSVKANVVISAITNMILFS